MGCGEAAGAPRAALCSQGASLSPGRRGDARSTCANTQRGSFQALALGPQPPGRSPQAWTTPTAPVAPPLALGSGGSLPGSEPQARLMGGDVMEPPWGLDSIGEGDRAGPRRGEVCGGGEPTRVSCEGSGRSPGEG